MPGSINVSYLARQSALLGGTACTAATAFPFLDAAGNQIIIPFIGSKKMDTMPFRIKLAGRCTGGASTVTFLASLYYGALTVANPPTISATAASNTLIETVPVMTITSLNANFYMEVTGIWDSTGGRITCSGWSLKSITDGTGTLTAHTIMDAVPAADTSLNTEAQSGFVPFATFGTNAQAANASYITLFSLEMI